MVLAIVTYQNPSFSPNNRHPSIILFVAGEMILMILNLGRQFQDVKGLRQSSSNVAIKEQYRRVCLICPSARFRNHLYRLSYII